MEDHSERAEPSRRNFAKSAIAALVAIPFLSSAMSGQRKRRGATQRKLIHLPAPPQTDGFNNRPVPGIEEHIPPLELTDGSLEINMYERFDVDDGEQIGARKWRYKKANFGNIKKVKIMVTNEVDLTLPYWCWYGPPYCTPQNVVVKIWLQEKESASNHYKPINMSLSPEIVVNGSGQLQLEINEKLAKNPKQKHPYRPYKYAHKGDGYGEHFRIGGIEVSSSNCGICRWTTRDFDHYQIQIFGPDIDPD